MYKNLIYRSQFGPSTIIPYFQRLLFNGNTKDTAPLTGANGCNKSNTAGIAARTLSTGIPSFLQGTTSLIWTVYQPIFSVRDEYGDDT